MGVKAITKGRKVYLPDIEYNELQAKLRKRGTNISKWFREKVREELYGVSGRYW